MSLSLHTNDTKLVHVDARFAGYHPHKGGYSYYLAGTSLLAEKFKGFTKDKPVDKPHFKTREENEPDEKPESVLETVPTPVQASKTVSFEVQELPVPE